MLCPYFGHKTYHITNVHLDGCELEESIPQFLEKVESTQFT